MDQQESKKRSSKRIHFSDLVSAISRKNFTCVEEILYSNPQYLLDGNLECELHSLADYAICNVDAFNILKLVLKVANDNQYNLSEIIENVLDNICIDIYLSRKVIYEEHLYFGDVAKMLIDGGGCHWPLVHL